MKEIFVSERPQAGANGPAIAILTKPTTSDTRNQAALKDVMISERPAASQVDNNYRLVLKPHSDSVRPYMRTSPSLRRTTPSQRQMNT